MSLNFEGLWDYVFEILTLVIAALAVFVAAGYHRRRTRVIKDLIYVEQENDALKKKNAALTKRLDEVDPEIFLAQLAKSIESGDLESAASRAEIFMKNHERAIGASAETLAERRLLDSSNDGLSALRDAERYCDIGLAAFPDSKHLSQLRTEIAFYVGEAGDSIDWASRAPMSLSPIRLYEIAETQYSKGNFSTSLIASKYALARCKKTSLAELSEDGKIAIQSQYARVLSALGESKAAAAEFEIALKRRLEIGNENNPNFASDLSNLALVLSDMGQTEDAIDNLVRAVDLDQKNNRIEKKSVVRLGNLGALLSKNGDNHQAAQLLKEACGLQLKLSGAKSADYASALMNFAGVSAELGDTNTALQSSSSALEIANQIYSPGHPDLIYSEFIFQYIRVLLSDEKNRIEKMRSIAASQSANLGAEHPHVQSMFRALSRIENRP